jgi:aminotransferase
MARGLDGVVNLAGGDPDFDTPPHIIDTMVEAIKKGQTHYPPPHGLPALKQAIAKYHGKHGVDWGPSDVIVTAGSGVSLFLSTAGTLNINDEVILLEPYFMAYSNLVEYTGAKEIGVPLNEENSYRLNVEALKEKITSKTKMIVLCNPNNPSGTVFTKDELKGISDLAIENDLLVLSDEVYCEFVWDNNKHVSIASLPEMKERTIITSSFSKTFAMTGWRLGYILAEENMIKQLQKIPVGQRTNTFVQLAGIAALEGPWTYVENMATEYDKRRLFMASRLDEINGINCHIPEGAFYLFPNIKDLNIGSERFCESLLKEKKILARPGTAFGKTGEFHIRIPLIKQPHSAKQVSFISESH